MLDATLAIIHHIFAFTLVGCLVGEWLLLMDKPSRSILKRLSIVDAAYGASAVASLGVGICRVSWGLKPASFYTGNPIFWAKMGAWTIVAIISILPTIRFIQWSRRKTIPSEIEFSAVRKFVSWEIVAFTLIPVFAALMARGYGY
jgi:putative membrane protein